MTTRRSSGTRNLSEIRRVLIVDDHHDSAELLALALQRDGHETRVAHDAQAALALAAQFRPNIAFLDIGLPGMNGVELARALRARPEHQGCKLVAVSGYDQSSRVMGQDPFDSHLVKPVDLSALSRLVLEATADHARVKPASA